MAGVTIRFTFPKDRPRTILRIGEYTKHLDLYNDNYTKFRDLNDIYEKYRNHQDEVKRILSKDQVDLKYYREMSEKGKKLKNILEKSLKDAIKVAADPSNKDAIKEYGTDLSELSKNVRSLLKEGLQNGPIEQRFTDKLGANILKAVLNTAGITGMFGSVSLLYLFANSDKTFIAKNIDNIVKSNDWFSKFLKSIIN